MGIISLVSNNCHFTTNAQQKPAETLNTLQAQFTFYYQKKTPATIKQLSEYIVK